MSGDAAEILFAGNAKGVLDEYKKMEKAHERQTQQLLAAMKVSKQTANDEKKLRQEVNAAIEKSRSPAEAYINTLNKWKEALQAGIITQETFNKLRDIEVTKLNAGKVAMQQKAAAEQEAARKSAEALQLKSAAEKEAAKQAEIAQQQALRAAAESKQTQLALQRENSLRQLTASALQKLQTPAQAYNETIKQYKQALQAGIITQNQFNQLRDKELSSLNANGAAQKQLNLKIQEEKKLRQEVAVAIEKARTPAEAYTATMNRYRQALQAGMITQQQFNRLSEEARKEAFSGQQSNELLTFSFTAVSGAVAAATRGLRAFSEEQKRIQQESAMTVEAMDAMARQYAVQAGIGEGDVNTYRDKILAQAKKNAVLPEKAFPAAIQLESSGFVGAVDSGTLDSFLKILSTSNQKMNDPKAIAMAMSQFMGAYKMQKTQANMLEIGSRMKGLMDTDLEMSDLSNFAKAAPGMAEAGIPLGEALSIMTSLRQTMDPAEAAVGVRNIVTFMQTAKNNKTQRKVLETLGLKNTDIDVVGETATEAMTRFYTALQQQPKENQTPLMEDMFGRENFNKAYIIFNGLKDMPKYTAAQGNVKDFIAGVNLNQQGPDANKIRQSIGLQESQLINDDTVAMRQFAIRQREIDYQKTMATIDSDPNNGFFGRNIAKGLTFAGSVIQSTLFDPFQQPEDYYGGEQYVRQSMRASQGAAFTEQDLRSRMNGSTSAPALDTAPIVNAINNQTAVLSGKLTPPAKPTDNPNLQGRPKN